MPALRWPEAREPRNEASKVLLGKVLRQSRPTSSPTPWIVADELPILRLFAAPADQGFWTAANDVLAMPEKAGKASPYSLRLSVVRQGV